MDMGSCALHDRLEPAEPHRDQLPNTGLPIRPFVDHREPLCLVRAQRQNDPSSGFDLIEDRRRQSLGGGRQRGSLIARTMRTRGPIGNTSDRKMRTFTVSCAI